jgi:signal transduction histidine kinase
MRPGLTGRMVLASGVVALLVSGAFVVLLLAIDNLRESADETQDAREELTAADRLEKLVIDLETGLRGFVITRQGRFLDPWNEARAAFPRQAGMLERLVADDPGHLRRVRRITQEVRSYIRDYATPLVAAARRGEASARSVATTEEGRRRVDGLRAEFDRLTATERARITAREESADAAARRAVAVGVAGIGGSIVLILVFTGYLTRVIVQPIRRASSMAGRLAGGDLSARVPVTGVAEIRALEQSFNTMATSLAASRDELTRLLEEQAALRRVATLVARTVSASELFETVTREVGLLSGADLARMERYEADGTVTGVGAWSRDAEQQLVVGTRIALEGVSIAALVRDSGGPVRVDTFAQASGPIAEEARALGIRSSVGCPIVVQGRLWGVIAASSKSEAPFAPDTESQIAEFTELVATAVANAEARAELAASRARIVSAADETRRHIERDLHDGTQQRLISLGLELRLAQSTVPPELTELREEIGRAAMELGGVTDDLREISRGIHPAILSEGGLGPALRTLARRSAIPVELEVRPERRFPAPVEVAAYYVVSESLANAAKHARASVAEVLVEARDGVLDLTVRDDGVGGADPGRGSGLAGLTDRVEALGGTLSVVSSAGEGTLLHVELPIEGG